MHLSQEHVVEGDAYGSLVDSPNHCLTRRRHTLS